MTVQLEAPEGYRYYTPVPIRYGDMDALGHVNNAKYLTYLEQARILYVNHHHLWDGSSSQLGLILAKVTIDYKLPLAMSDGLAHVWTRTSRLGTRSFDMEHIIHCQRDGQTLTAATAQIVMVVFDYQANASVPIPQDWRDRLIDFEPALPE